MKFKPTARDLLIYLVAIIPLVYLELNYASMPATIPVHFNFHGPDRYGSKDESWLFILIMTVTSIGTYIFLKNLPSIDPKRTKTSSDTLVSKISVLVVVFLTVLQIIIINAMQGYLLSMERMMVPAMGIFFCLMGNLMLNVKPNYFVGIRLPWTLENEDNWRKTHRLAGKLWFAGGLIAAIIGCIFSIQYSLPAFLIIITVITAIPCIYSYTYFKKEQHK